MTNSKYDRIEKEYKNYKIYINIRSRDEKFYGDCTIKQASGHSIEHNVDGGFTPTFPADQDFHSRDELVEHLLSAAHTHIDEDFKIFRKLSHKQK